MSETAGLKSVHAVALSIPRRRDRNKIVRSIVTGVVVACLGVAHAGEPGFAPYDRSYQPRPIPSGKDAPTLKQLNYKMNAWWQTMCLRVYRQRNTAAPVWLAAGDSFIRKSTMLGKDLFVPAKVAPLVKDAANLEAQGCDDPVVLLYAGLLYEQAGQAVKAESLLTRAVKGLVNGPYPRIMCYWSTLKLINLNVKVWEGRAETIVQNEKDVVRFLAEAAADEDLRNGNQQFHGLLSSEHRRFGRLERETALYEALANVKNPDPWIALIIKGHYFDARAWDQRGGGWAHQVTPQGWQGFAKDLAVARECFTEAYALHPEFAMAAVYMMNVALGSGGTLESRYWFDAAVNSCMDFTPAYDRMLWALRPRWGGSHEAMLAFGRECLQTGRFDTPVPGYYLQSLIDITSEQDDPRIVFRAPEVYGPALRCFRGYAGQQDDPAMVTTFRWRSFMVTYAGAHFAEAAMMLKELGTPSPLPISRFCGMSVSNAVGEVMLRAGPHADMVAKAENLFEDNQSTNAIPLYRRLGEISVGQPLAQSYIQARLATLETREKFLKGDWFSIQPSVDLEGWRPLSGKWSVDTNGVLHCLPEKVGFMKLETILDVGFEVRGEMAGRYDGGIRISRIPVGFGYILAVVDGCKKEVRVSGLKDITKQLPIQRDNPFHCQFWNGHVSISARGMKGLENVEAMEEMPEGTHLNLVLMGDNYGKQGQDILFRRLELRRLTSPPSWYKEDRKIPMEAGPR